MKYINKKLGQIFLNNKIILKKIINKINPNKKQIFIEIGCGTGQLTQQIIKYTNNIIATEIDINLIKKINYKIKKKIKILNINILKFNYYKTFIKYKKKIRIFGNIPYYISSKLIYKFIFNYKYIKDIHILVQKEFYECLIAKSNNKKYCKLSILINLYFKIIKLINIKKKYFSPKPKIDSVLIKLQPIKNKYKNIKLKYLIHIINISLIRKNKKIKNNIKQFLDNKLLKQININPNTRAKHLSINNFIDLYKLINKHKK